MIQKFYLWDRKFPVQVKTFLSSRRGTKCYLNSLMPFLRSGLVQSPRGERRDEFIVLERERRGEK